jgi:hypothetical protein
MQFPLIEFRARRTGALLMPPMALYEFLRILHTQSPAGDEFGFDELRILIDGEELLPNECGHA